MKYRTIVADPPWPYSRTGVTIRSNAVRAIGREISHGLPYLSMELEEIMALPVSDWAGNAAHLYLWTTNSFVTRAYSVVEAWGFKPSILLTWCKAPRGMGLGDAFGSTTEHIVFAHRGGLRPLERAPSTWWQWKRGPHSRKPDAFYDLVEQVSPGPYLDVFSRQHRMGWDSWGNEVYCPPGLPNASAP